ncbi:alpha/beta hydrolase family protein, partial [candidate division KSB1 bacterium]
VSTDPADHPARDFERGMRNKARTDSIIFAQCEGVVDVQKTEYRSSIGDMDIPVYIFQPLEKRGPKGHAALVWVHGGVHGDFTEMYFRFVPEAVKRGYVVIAPEYRGSTGYGPDHYFAIDYGGYEVDDCLTAVNYMVENMPHVDPDRIGIWGLSHGGFIALHSVFRDDNPYKCGVALVPVSNLIFRLSYKGPGYQRYFATQKRIQGLPYEKREIYVERSPVYHADKLKVPLLVHIATNDQDVNYVECEMMVHALKAKKPDLAETKVYVDPPHGHTFTLRGDSPQLRDSWIRQWAFLEWNLRPDIDKSKGN